MVKFKEICSLFPLPPFRVSCFPWVGPEVLPGSHSETFEFYGNEDYLSEYLDLLQFKK